MLIAPPEQLVPADGEPLVSSGLLDWLRACRGAGSPLVSLCTGVAVLAETGLLHVRRAAETPANMVLEVRP